MAVFCQNLTLVALSSRYALSMQVGALFKKFGLFLNTPLITAGAIFVWVLYKYRSYGRIYRSHSEDGHNTLLRTVGTQVPNYTLSVLRRLLNTTWQSNLRKKGFETGPFNCDSTFFHWMCFCGSRAQPVESNLFYSPTDVLRTHLRNDQLGNRQFTEWKTIWDRQL
jgi:hypothetical protein